MTTRHDMDPASGKPQHGADRAEGDMTLHEERLQVDTVTEETGRVRAVKHVDTDTRETVVPRGVEHADLERVSVAAEDSGQDSGEVETLPDGSLSIPVFEEQLVVEKRLVVRERVIVRKHTVYEEHVVSAELKRERLVFETEGDVRLVDDAEVPPSA